MPDPTTAEPQIGRALSERSFSIDASAFDDYYNGLALSREPNALVPTMLAGSPDNDYFGEIAFSNHRGHLWMRQEFEFFAPLEADERYVVSGQIRDIYARRDRSVVQYEVELHDADGQLALRSQHHQSFLRDREASGQVQFRDPGKKPGARKFELPAGEPFGGLERKITLEMCGEFFHGNASYHTDRAASKELGFQDVVVGGRMTLAYAGHILEELFGAPWWASGRLDLKFTNPTWPDDVVTARGIVTGPDPDDPSRTGAFVWIEKSDGTIVLVANASAIS